MNAITQVSETLKENVILIVTPTGKDSELACEVLEKAGFSCVACPSLSDVCRNTHDLAGALLLAEEGLSYEEIPRLGEWLNKQPPWSDLPIIVLTSGGAMKRMDRWHAGQLGSRANVTLLERPFHVATLISVLEGALRARRRQFEMRDLLEQRENLLGMEKRAREEAEKVNFAKDEFLATLSHELRTPLTTMLGWSKILSKHKLDKATTDRAIQAIERSAKSQAQLIDDLLDVSRIITGKFQIEKKAMDLIDLIHSSIDMIRPTMEAKDLAVALQISENPGPIAGDFHRLQQVLWNILSNAVKFTPPGGRITVTLERTNSHATIVVQDTGKGIDPEILPFIFERFRQADSSYTRNEGGLGLGLAIVQHIVTLHSGRVFAESEGEGKGSTFKIVLPVVTTETKSFRTVRSKRASQKADLHGLNILVVEDDSESRDLIALILEKANATVTCVSSVAEALAVLKDSKPDLLISDIGMPAEDGYQLISLFRSNPATREIPAIALTAYASSADRLKAINAGFQFHMSKPLDPSDLIETVAELARKSPSLS
jgi:signal transduction histidine kinase/ActR/RegA family two-component response regulator